MLPMSGFAFWFLIAFPIGDRNESYIWIAYLQQFSLPEIVQNAIPSIRGFRPLAQAVTWCLYHLSGQNGVLVQFMSFILLCVATGVIVSLTPKDKSFIVRLLYLVMGFVYFPAFYYIFNLHGIFYSVILLTVAMMLKADEGVVLHWRRWFPAAIILALFHPLILLLYLGLAAGWMLERKQIGTARIGLFAVLFMLSMALIRALVPFSMTSLIDVQNLLGTMNNVERHTVVKLFTFALCLLTLRTKHPGHRMLLLVLMLLYTPLAIVYDLPLLLLLGLLAVTTLVMMRKWSMAGILVTALLFPLAVGSGAPTKASVFLFLIPYALLPCLPVNYSPKQWIAAGVSIIMMAGIVICAALIRLEAKIPVVSRLVRPLLVEKGKTYQLERALEMAAAEVPPRRIVFLQEKQLGIRDSGQPEDRSDFPPTKQKELDVYQQFKLTGRLDGAPVWYMAFGSELPADTLVLVHAIQERNCEAAYVYEPVRDGGE